MNSTRLTRRDVLKCAGVLGLLTPAVMELPLPAKADEKLDKAVIDVGSRRQLFVDDLLVEQRRNVEFRMYELGKQRSPVVVPDQPWETHGRSRLGSYCSVIRDGDRFHLWYDFLWNCDPPKHQRGTAYAVSPFETFPQATGTNSTFESFVTLATKGG